MKGTISIGKVTCGGDRPDYVHIEIRDKLSSIAFTEIEMSIEDFGKAIMGQSFIPMEFKVRGLDKLGKKMEVKTIEVAVLSNPDRVGLADNDIDRAVMGHEVDGWIGRREDCKNYHNHVISTSNTQTYRVVFQRWVDVDEASDGKN